MKPSNVSKKIREPPNVTKIRSNVMLKLPNVMMKPSNVRKKKKKKKEGNRYGNFLIIIQ